MGKFTVVLSKKVVKQLDKLPETVIDAVIENITSLEDNPRPFGYKN